MPVWIRRTLYALVALVLVLIALAVYLIATFEPDRYKGVAIDWMKTQRNRTLVIDGPIKLSVFPRLEIRLSKISLSEAGRSDEFAALDEAELAVELLPLLRGQVSIDRVQASGIRATLLTDASGRRNIDDLVAPSAPAGPGGAAAKSTAPPIAPLALDVRSIALRNVRARVKDERAGIDGEVIVKELSTGRIADGVPSKVKLAVQLGLRAPALKGELSGSCEVTPQFQSASVRVAAMDLSYKGDAPGASGIDANVRGELGIDGTKASVQAHALKLRVSASAGTTRLTEGLFEVARFTHDPAAKRLTIGGLKVRATATQAGKPLEAALDWPELDVAGEKLKGSGLSGNFKLAGDLPLEGRFTSGAPSGNFDNVLIPSFELKASSQSAQRKVAATVRADLSIQPQSKAIALDKIGVDAKLENPALKPLALSLSGQAGASAQSARWNLTGQVNASPFRSEGTIGLTSATPNVKASARFETLDLNAILPPPGPAAAPAGGTAGADPDAPIDLSPLRSVNGTLNVRAASVAALQYRVSDVVLDATLDAGVLRVTALQGKTWGGTLDATAFADSRANRVGLKASASGVDVQALLKDVANKDLLEGKGRVIADLESAGRSVSEMKSRLNGSASVQLRDGAVKGFNLAKSLRQAKAALTTRKDAAERANRTEKTDFSEMSASFKIDSGIARSTDLDMKSPYLRVGGEGLIDVPKGRLDYLVRATVTDTSKGQDGTDLAALRGLTIPVQLSGPFDAVDWKIQWSAVAAGAVKSQLKDKLQEKLGAAAAPAAAASAPAVKEQLKEKAQDKVKEKLKGLFK